MCSRQLSNNEYLPVRLVNKMYDYLVVGAGLTGMCFVDVILKYTDASVMLVDNKNGPGGHWFEPYKYVNLHQNADTYGIESLELKDGSGSAVKKHFEDALEVFKKNKNFHVQFNVTIDMERIDRCPRHKTLVDATYLTVSRLPTKWKMTTPWTLKLRDIPHVVVGGGKTGMDTCIWLRKHGVPVTWIVSHDAVWLKREKVNNLGPVPKSVLCARIMEFVIKRIDPWFALKTDDRIFSESKKPSRHRCAIIKEEECKIIKTVKIIRHGYVKERKENTLYFQNGEQIDFGNSEFVDCVQNGCPIRETVPIFQKNKIVLQPIVMCQQSFSATTIAKIEVKKVHINLTSLKHPKTLEDGVTGYSASMVNLALLYNSEISDWVFKSRLNQYTR